MRSSARPKRAALVRSRRGSDDARMESTSGAARRSVLWRWRGLLALGAVVVLGILPGAGYLQWRAPRVRAEIEARMKAAPTDPEQRLEHWLSFGEPQLQTRLTALRLSSSRPWLVTHLVERAGEEPEIWGVELEGPRPGRVARAGLRVEILLPAPRLLGHGHLQGDRAQHVPRYPSRAAAGDPRERAERLAVWFLAPLIEALPKDIPGAELVIRIEAAEGER